MEQGGLGTRRTRWMQGAMAACWSPRGPPGDTRAWLARIRGTESAVPAWDERSGLWTGARGARAQDRLQRRRQESRGAQDEESGVR